MKKMITLCFLLLFVSGPALAGDKKQEILNFLKVMEADHLKWTQQISAAEKLIAPYEKEYNQHVEDVGLVKVGVPFFTKEQYHKKWIASGRLNKLNQNVAPYFAAMKPIRKKFMDKYYQDSYLRQEALLIKDTRSYMAQKNLKDAHKQLMKYELASKLGYFPASKITESTIKIENLEQKHRLQAMKHYSQANKHQRNKKNDMAIFEMTQAINLQPDNPMWHAVRAEFQLKKKAYDLALEDLRRGEKAIDTEFAKSQKPDFMQERYWVRVYKGFAQVHKAKKEYDTAISYLEKALQKPEGESDKGVLTLEIAKILYIQKAYQATLKKLDEVLATKCYSSTKLLAMKYKGRSYKKLGNPDAALESYRAALPFADDKKNQKGTFHLYLETGDFLRDRGDFQEALAEYDKALTLEKMRKRYFYKAYSAKGRTYTLTGDFPKARAAFESYGQAKPKSSAPGRELAIFKLLTDKKQDLTAARDLLENSYKLSKFKDKNTALYLCYVKSRLGENGKQIIMDHKKRVKNNPKKQLNIFRVITGEQTIDEYLAKISTKSGACWSNYYAGLYFLANHQDKLAAKYLGDSVATGLTTSRALVWARELLKNTAGAGKGVILLD